MATLIAKKPYPVTRDNRYRIFTTGPALRSRPEPATHQRAKRARRRAPGERNRVWGQALVWNSALA